MAAPRIIIPSVTLSLPACTPNLMPFHIDYTGPANVSRFMKIEKVKPEELVEEHKEPLKGGEELLKGGEVPSGVDCVEVTRDAPMDTDVLENEGPTPLKRTATDVEMHDSTTSAALNANIDSEMPPSTTPMLTVSRTESTIIESQTTTSTLASSSSLSSHLTTATPTALLEDADRRFVSTFRGRTIHGLTIDLPPGYGGLVLRREGNDAVNPGTGDAAVAVDIKDKSRAKPNVKAGATGTKGKGKDKEEQQTKKAPPRRGRLTRSATLSKPEVIAVEEEPVQEGEDDKMADITPTRGDDNDDDVADGEVPNEHPVRRLIPHAQFSSFTLWHQDRPVDKGRDEYCRTLTEWIALSHEIHRTDL